MKCIKSIFLLLFLISIFGITACKSKYAEVPNNVINPNKFTDIVLDIRLAEANQKILNQYGFRKQNSIDSAYQLIYKLHDITPEEFNRSYTFYLENPEWMDKISNDVIEKLNQLN